MNDRRHQQTLALPPPDVIRTFTAVTAEAHRQGLDGDSFEWQLYVTPWGFDLGDVRREVRLWYGLSERQVPVAMGRYLAGALPAATLVEVKDGGHFATVNNYIEDILDYLVAVD